MLSTLLSYLVTCHSEHYQQGIYSAAHHPLDIIIVFHPSAIVHRHFHHPSSSRDEVCGAENAHSFRTPDFTRFGEFMTSPIHYIYIT